MNKEMHQVSDKSGSRNQVGSRLECLLSTQISGLGKDLDSTFSCFTYSEHGHLGIQRACRLIPATKKLPAFVKNLWETSAP